MSTPEVTAVNGTPPPRAVMMSVKALAERDAISKAAVSKRVDKLRANGLHVELDRQGRVALVNSVQYDELLGRFSDPSKTQAPSARGLPEATSESYEEARRQLTWVEAERAKLKLEAEQRLYVRVEDLEAAALRIGETIIGSIDQLLQQSDELAAAVAREGIHGLRSALKKVAAEMRTEIADAMSVLIDESRQ